MILVIDNYDSFVYNLVRYVRELGGEALVRRHDAISLDEVATLRPSHILLSPGPCGPAEAGISTDVVRRFGATTPILGVCLGHQCIGAAYGAAIVRAARPMHGKTSAIGHDGRGIFAGIPNPFRATRYHSLVIARAGLPRDLQVIATAEDGEIMAVAHAHHPVIGLQFHPESVQSEHGHRLLTWFLHGAPRAPSFSHAKAREHAIEDVVGRDHADEVVQRADGGAQVRRGGGGLDPLDPCVLERLHFAERPLQGEAVAGARHHRLDLALGKEVPERDLREATAQRVQAGARHGGDSEALRDTG